MSTPSSPDRFDFRAEVPSGEDLGRVHFIAIGGAGMSGVARIMAANGLAVSGSDAKDSPVLRALEAEGATVHVGHDASYVDEADTVVISSAIRENNVELARARERGLRVLHRSQGLAAMTTGRRVVAVAGANGKTTTTSMLTVALLGVGADPSFAIGGELAKHGTNAHAGSGQTFVVEADESDGSFLVYRPEVAVVTNVQPDHLDHYGTFENVKAAYLEFARSVRPGGLLVACADDAGSLELAGAARAAGVRVLTYGFAEDADVVIGEVRAEGFTSHAQVRLDGIEHDLTVHLPGRHNVLNATAALVAATAGLGHEPEAVLAGLAGYTGTRRRFELKGSADGVTLVDDYAHNPGKVAAVVATARALVPEGARLVVVFQPHLYSRTMDFTRELAAGLAPADVVVLMDIYAAREDPVPGVSGAIVADALAADPTFTGEVVYEPSWSATAAVVADHARPGDLVLTIGAGDVTMLGPEILRLLEQREAARR